MDKKYADFVVKAVTEILAGHDLVSVATRPDREPDVRVHQTFEKAYQVDYKDGRYSVALCDSYGVMTGADAEDWTIDPDKRAVIAKTTNGPGDALYFSWVVTDDEDGTLWNKMRKLQEES